MVDIEKVLFKILLLDGNEAMLLDNIAYQDFKTLTIELIKIKYNIRYCSKEKCQCHPETIIKKLLNYNKKLCNFLQENHLLEGIKCLIENYKPIIAKGIFEDENIDDEISKHLVIRRKGE